MKSIIEKYLLIYKINLKLKEKTRLNAQKLKILLKNLKKMAFQYFLLAIVPFSLAQSCFPSDLTLKVSEDQIVVKITEELAKN
jgi:hypothetical protein